MYYEFYVIFLMSIVPFSFVFISARGAGEKGDLFLQGKGITR